MGRRLGAQVPVELQNVALKWGIVGAILMRGVMILVGVELIGVGLYWSKALKTQP